MLVAAVALLIATAATGTRTWLLICFGLVAGSVSAVYIPMSGTIARRLVNDEALPRALATQTTGFQALQLVGPPIAGALVGLVGFSGVAGVDAVTFGIVITAVVAIGGRMATPSDASSNHPRFLAAARDGLRVAARTPGLAAGLLLVGIVASFGLPVSSLLVPLLAHSHHWPASIAGTLVACQAIGSITASVVIARHGLLGRPGLVAALSTTPMGLGLACLAFLGSAVAPVGMLVFGGGMGLFIAHIAPAVLSASPRTHMSRVQSIIALVQTVPILVTNNLLGWVSGRFDVSGALVVVGAALLAAGAAAGASSALRNLGLR